MSTYSDITPMDLVDTLKALVDDVNENGYTQHNGTPVDGVNLRASTGLIDDAKSFMSDQPTASPAMGVAFIGSSPHSEVSARAGQELLTFVILIAVECTGSENENARKAQILLYHLQAALHGRPTDIGRPWKWAGHGIVPDDGNDSWVMYQQTWQLIHSFNGYSGK